MSTFRKPRWRDPRLGVGILLVAVSVALGGWVFAQADKTYPVYVARQTTTVGQQLSDADLELVDVNLGSAQKIYLSPQDPINDGGNGVVFLRSVPQGELIALDALGPVHELSMRPVSITVTNPTPLNPGDVVDLWVMVEDFTGTVEHEPELVAQGLHVSAVADEETLFASTSAHVVHVLVEEDDVGRVLGAIGSKTQVTLVPRLEGGP